MNVTLTMGDVVAHAQTYLDPLSVLVTLDFASWSTAKVVMVRTILVFVLNATSQ